MSEITEKITPEIIREFLQALITIEREHSLKSADFRKNKIELLISKIYESLPRDEK